VHQTIDEDLAELPAASECGPVLDIAVALGQAAMLGHAMVQELLRLTESSTRSTRVWAMLALADIGTVRAIDAVLQALMDDDPHVRRGARWAAISLSGGHPSGRAMREAIEQLVASTVVSVPTRLFAIDTLGRMRDPSSVPVLIQTLGEPDQELHRAAIQALKSVTRTDIEGGAQKWTVWWTENQTRPRIEWLIDALTSPAVDLREAAARELAERTGRDFGYRADMPLEARASVQSRYRALRSQEGREQREG
jgi:HEAT repeat protein